MNLCLARARVRAEGVQSTPGLFVGRDYQGTRTPAPRRVGLVRVTRTTGSATLNDPFGDTKFIKRNRQTARPHSTPPSNEGCTLLPADSSIFQSRGRRPPLVRPLPLLLALSHHFKPMRFLTFDANTLRSEHLLSIFNFKKKLKSC